MGYHCSVPLYSTIAGRGTAPGEKSFRVSTEDRFGDMVQCFATAGSTQCSSGFLAVLPAARNHGSGTGCRMRYHNTNHDHYMRVLLGSRFVPSMSIVVAEVTATTKRQV